MYILRLLPLILLTSFPILAKEATALVTVEGVVSIPTCSINGKSLDGLSQTVNMGVYTANEVIEGNTKNIDIPIIVHCSTPTNLKGISLSFSTLGPYGPVGSSQPGVIKTNLQGVSIEMKWKSDDTPVSLNAGEKKLFSNNDSNNYDASIISKVLPMPGFSLATMEKGHFKSGINVILSYY